MIQLSQVRLDALQQDAKRRYEPSPTRIVPLTVSLSASTTPVTRSFAQKSIGRKEMTTCHVTK